MIRNIPFSKMQGAGNDYIYVNTIASPLEKPESLAIAWSDRHKGIGSDGLVLIGRSKRADFSMRIFNADGSEALMCGNASRCIARYVFDKGLTRKRDLSLETRAGIRQLHLNINKEERVESVTVDMGEPVLACKAQVSTPDGALSEREFTVEGRTFPATYVGMGNPHLVCFIGDVEHFPVDVVGRELERHPLFPQRINVEFVEPQPDGTLRMRVWERGSGITQACGTGACATAVAAHLTGRSPRLAQVRMDGGTLEIEWTPQGNILMTGPAEFAFEGTISSEF